MQHPTAAPAAILEHPSTYTPPPGSPTTQSHPEAAAPAAVTAAMATKQQPPQLQGTCEQQQPPPQLQGTRELQQPPQLQQTQTEAEEEEEAEEEAAEAAGADKQEASEVTAKDGQEKEKEKEKKRSRSSRCGACPECVNPDCGSCAHCQDKKSFGGPGVKKQACLQRRCQRRFTQPQPQQLKKLISSSSLPPSDPDLKDALCGFLMLCGPAPPAAPAAPPASKAAAAHKRVRSSRCGRCDGCKRSDCGECLNCRDKPKYGGSGVKKQACVLRKCSLPQLPPTTETIDEGELSAASTQPSPLMFPASSPACLLAALSHLEPDLDLSASEGEEEQDEEQQQQHTQDSYSSSGKGNKRMRPEQQRPEVEAEEMAAGGLGRNGKRERHTGYYKSMHTGKPARSRRTDG